MPGSDSFDDFVPAGLASLGVEADETELALMRAAHELWWPAIGQLLSSELGVVAAEADADLSRPPEGR
jgi:hypothetical protein